MGIKKLCSVHTYRVRLYKNVTGAAMGKSTEWTDGPTGTCRFNLLSSTAVGDGAAFRVRDPSITHAIYFGADPGIPNGSRIQWTGTTKGGAFASPVEMTLLGPVTFDSTMHLWKVLATTHELANLPGGATK